MRQISEPVHRFLDHWRGTRETPGLWRTFMAGRFDSTIFRSECLKLIAAGGSVRESIDSLIEEGLLTAAEALIERERMREDGLDVADVQSRLQRQVVLTQSEVFASIEELSRRLPPLGAHAAIYTKEFDEARSCATGDRMQALAILDDVRRKIETAEEEAASQIRALARSHPRSKEQWSAAIDRACADRNIGLARALLSRGPDDDAILLSAFEARPNPLARIGSSQEALRWIVDGAGGSVDFYSSWDPVTRANPTLTTGMHAAHALFCLGEKPQEAAESFVAALRELVSAAPPYGPIVSCVGGFRTTLSGLDSPYAPTFDSGVLPLFIELPGSTIVQPEPARRRSLLFTVDKSTARDRSFIAFDIFDLLWCGSDPRAFRTNFLRRLVEQVPAGEFIPTSSQAPTDWMMLAHALIQVDANSPFLLLEGPAGVGKTALLSQCGHTYGAGYSIITVSPPLDQAMRNRVDSAALVGPRGTPAQRLVLIDDGHRLSGADLEFLSQSVARQGGRLRVIVVARPGLSSRLGALLAPLSVRQVPLIAFETLVRMATNLIDMSGYRVPSRPVVDRIAFHAYGRPSLLFELLKAVYRDLSESGIPRSGSIGRAQIDNALVSPSFRRALRAVLLTPVEESARAAVVLATSLICLSLAETSEIPVDDIENWLISEGVVLSRDEVLAELHTLQALGLLNLSDSSAVSFSIYGGGGQLTSLINDLGTHFVQLKQRIAAESPVDRKDITRAGIKSERA